MQKIVIDTNVIVSALVSEGLLTKLLKSIIRNDDFQICLSEEVFDEYSEVLGRSKFTKSKSFSTQADMLIEYLYTEGKFYYPKFQIKLLSDLSDNKFLELAQEAKANYLITGNVKDFNLVSFKGTKILSPRKFWEEVADVTPKQH